MINQSRYVKIGEETVSNTQPAKHRPDFRALLALMAKDVEANHSQHPPTEGNKPGHKHERPGIWNGTEQHCESCAQWSAAKWALAHWTPDDEAEFLVRAANHAEQAGAWKLVSDELLRHEWLMHAIIHKDTFQDTAVAMIQYLAEQVKKQSEPDNRDKQKIHVEEGRCYIHVKKRDMYKVLAISRDEKYPQRSLITYQLSGEPNGMKWTRPLNEFADGRFEQVAYQGADQACVGTAPNPENDPQLKALAAQNPHPARNIGQEVTALTERVKAVEDELNRRKETKPHNISVDVSCGEAAPFDQQAWDRLLQPPKMRKMAATIPVDTLRDVVDGLWRAHQSIHSVTLDPMWSQHVEVSKGRLQQWQTHIFNVREILRLYL